jgi:DNA processing protein
MEQRVDHEQRRARAVLSRIAEPGDVALAALVDRHGPVAVVDGLRRGDTFGREQAAAWRVRLAGHDPDADLEQAARVGARLVCPGDDEWPASLDDLLDVVALDAGTPASPSVDRSDRHDRQQRLRAGGVPLALWVRGRGGLADLCAASVSVVGARAATAYGTEVAGDLGHAVAGRGVAVVSGAAYGVDGAAHRGALAASAPTVAVLACGVDVGYPRGHANLLERIAESGLVVSEVPPGSAPSRVRFLVRNRLIAALSRGSVVVEAAVRSGALNTARWAQQMMRPVMGVPGPVTSAMSAGVHQMLREGMAVLVTDGDEVLETISAIGENTLPLRHGETRPRDRLDEVTRRVLEAVPVARPVGADRIARTAGLPRHEVELRLGRLLLQDFVERAGDRWRLSAAARAADGTGPGGRR